jgi:prevent-host-death family protein
MSSIRVDIRDAKIHLGRYLKIVQKGNELILTDHGRPVGKNVPVVTSDLTLKGRIARLVEKGVIEPFAGERMRRLPPPLAVPGEAARRMLHEDRQ